MNFEDHAIREFKAAGWLDEDGKYCDEMQEMICLNVLELLKDFSGQGHSGSSAPYAINLFTTLAKFNPITGLTGKDDEWTEVGDDLFQNKRDCSVFKNGKSGEAFWIDGKIFRNPNGSTYTSRDSRVPVVFPWIKPESIVIDRMPLNENEDMTSDVAIDTVLAFVGDHLLETYEGDEWEDPDVATWLHEMNTAVELVTNLRNK